MSIMRCPLWRRRDLSTNRKNGAPIAAVITIGTSVSLHRPRRDVGQHEKALIIETGRMIR
jgi:hypothetical protein